MKLLGGDQEIDIIPSTDKEIKDKVDSQDISMGFIIEKGFGDTLLTDTVVPVKIIKNFDNGETVILEQKLSSELTAFMKVEKDSFDAAEKLGSKPEDLSSKILSGLSTDNKVGITDSDRILDRLGTTQRMTTNRLLGFLVMFIWFVIVQGLRTLIEEKENNTYYRILSTPVSYTRFLLSKVSAAYLFGILHVIVILYAGRYFLKISILNNIIPISLVFGVYLFLLTGITLMIALFMKRHDNFTVTFGILITVTGILGGSFFPLDTAPGYIVTISKFTPEYWTLTILKDVINGKGLAQNFAPLGILLFAGCISLCLAFVLVKKNMLRKIR
jgi:ABC-2 type transport system permease protein